MGHAVFILSANVRIAEEVRAALPPELFRVEYYRRQMDLELWVEENRCDILVADLPFPKEVRQGEALELFKARNPGLSVLLLTETGEADDSVCGGAMWEGVCVFARRTFNHGDIVRSLNDMSAYLDLVSENRELRSQLESGDSLGWLPLGGGEESRRLENAVGAAALSASCVLVRGERGTGRTLVAREIARRSGREPLTVLDCRTAPPETISRTLSGELGADRGGTLHLREIAALDGLAQAKLLRAARDGFPQRLVCSTRDDLEKAAAEGSFREDLYAELSKLQICLKPLREMRGEIPAVAAELARRAALRFRVPFRKLSRQALAALRGMPFPGNFTELDHLLARAVLTCRGGEIELSGLLSGGEGGAEAQAQPGGATLDEMECEAIRRTLAATGGNMLRAARLLDISRSTLYGKVRKHGLDRAGKRAQF